MPWFDFYSGFYGNLARFSYDRHLLTAFTLRSVKHEVELVQLNANGFGSLGMSRILLGGVIEHLPTLYLPAP